jgi:ATP-dependent Zn protease
MAEKYLFEWGMTDFLGPINYLELNKNLSNENLQVLKTFIKKVENFCEKTLIEHKNSVDQIATSLLDQETIIYDDIIKLLGPSLKNSLKIPTMFD